MSVTLPRPIEPVRLPEREVLVAWAKEHKLDCPEHGRIPDEISERYIGYRLRARKRLLGSD